MDMKKTDVCIKAFSTEVKENDISSNVYQILNNDIYKIEEETTFKELKNQLITNIKVKLYEEMFKLQMGC